ncbi:MAG: OadG family protein [Chloroflexi bacterium]|nr:OadG family protein [Chloroflexota bacterium]
MDWGFGLTMMVIGMTVTLLTLYLLGWVIRLLIKLFPFRKEEETKTRPG